MERPSSCGATTEQYRCAKSHTALSSPQHNSHRSALLETSCMLRGKRRSCCCKPRKLWEKLVSLPRWICWSRFEYCPDGNVRQGVGRYGRSSCRIAQKFVSGLDG